MPILSAGLLVYRKTGILPEVLLIHHGGPFFVKKDIGAWSVPKGIYETDEHPLEAAKREFEEETGNKIEEGICFPLQPVKSKGGKILQVWAVEADFKKAFLQSNLFEMEWPPHSGKKQLFPEADKAEWFPFDEAKEKIYPYQASLINELEEILNR